MPVTIDAVVEDVFAPPITLKIPAKVAEDNGLEDEFEVHVVTQDELADYLKKGEYRPGVGTGVLHLFY